MALSMGRLCFSIYQPRVVIFLDTSDTFLVLNKLSEDTFS